MENWKDYKGYKISSFGNVIGAKGKPIKTRPNSVGYIRVNIGGKYKLLHRIVAILFVPNPDPKHKIEVDHIDGNITNNRADNLQWLTPSENSKKAKKEKRKNNKNHILIFNDNGFIAEVITPYRATTFLQKFGFSSTDTKFVIKVANGKFKKYKGYNFAYAKTLFDND